MEKNTLAAFNDEGFMEMENIIKEVAFKNELSEFNVKEIIKSLIVDDNVKKFFREYINSDFDVNLDINEKKIYSKKEEYRDKLKKYTEHIISDFKPKITRAKIKELKEQGINTSTLWLLSPVNLKPSKNIPAENITVPENKSVPVQFGELDFPESDDTDDDFVPGKDDLFEENTYNEELFEGLNDDEYYKWLETIFNEPLYPNVLFDNTHLYDQDINLVNNSSNITMGDDNINNKCKKPEVISNDKEFLNKNAEEDDENDPEYDLMAELENFTEDPEDLRFDKAVHVSRKELNDLLNELFEDDELGMGGVKLIKEHNHHHVNQTTDLHLTTEQRFSHHQNERKNEISNIYEDKDHNINNNQLNLANFVPNLNFTSFELLKLKDQMKKHTQMLAQTYLLCCENQNLYPLRQIAKSNLKELDKMALHFCPQSKSNSLFHSPNLPLAIELLDRENDRLNQSYLKPTFKTGTQRCLGIDSIHEIASNKLFSCVELLPHKAFNSQRALMDVKRTRGRLLTRSKHKFYDVFKFKTVKFQIPSYMDMEWIKLPKNMKKISKFISPRAKFLRCEETLLAYGLSNYCQHNGLLKPPPPLLPHSKPTCAGSSVDLNVLDFNRLNFIKSFIRSTPAPSGIDEKIIDNATKISGRRHYKNHSNGANLSAQNDAMTDHSWYPAYVYVHEYLMPCKSKRSLAAKLDKEARYVMGKIVEKIKGARLFPYLSPPPSSSCQAATKATPSFNVPSISTEESRNSLITFSHLLSNEPMLFELDSSGLIESGDGLKHHPIRDFLLSGGRAPLIECCGPSFLCNSNNKVQSSLSSAFYDKEESLLSASIIYDDISPLDAVTKYYYDKENLKVQGNHFNDRHTPNNKKQTTLPKFPEWLLSYHTYLKLLKVPNPVVEPCSATLDSANSLMLLSMTGIEDTCNVVDNQSYLLNFQHEITSTIDDQIDNKNNGSTHENNNNNNNNINNSVDNNNTGTGADDNNDNNQDNNNVNQTGGDSHNNEDDKNNDKNNDRPNCSSNAASTSSPLKGNVGTNSWLLQLAKGIKKKYWKMMFHHKKHREDFHHPPLIKQRRFVYPEELLNQEKSLLLKNERGLSSTTYPPKPLPHYLDYLHLNIELNDNLFLLGRNRSSFFSSNNNNNRRFKYLSDAAEEEPRKLRNRLAANHGIKGAVKDDNDLSIEINGPSIHSTDIKSPPVGTDLDELLQASSTVGFLPRGLKNFNLKKLNRTKKELEDTLHILEEEKRQLHSLNDENGEINERDTAVADNFLALAKKTITPEKYQNLLKAIIANPDFNQPAHLVKLHEDVGTILKDKPDLFDIFTSFIPVSAIAYHHFNPYVTGSSTSSNTEYNVTTPTSSITNHYNLESPAHLSSYNALTFDKIRIFLTKLEIYLSRNNPSHHKRYLKRISDWKLSAGTLKELHEILKTFAKPNVYLTQQLNSIFYDAKIPFECFNNVEDFEEIDLTVGSTKQDSGFSVTPFDNNCYSYYTLVENNEDLEFETYPGIIYPHHLPLTESRGMPYKQRTTKKKGSGGGTNLTPLAPSSCRPHASGGTKDAQQPHFDTQLHLKSHVLRVARRKIKNKIRIQTHQLKKPNSIKGRRQIIPLKKDPQNDPNLLIYPSGSSIPVDIVDGVVVLNFTEVDTTKNVPIFPPPTNTKTTDGSSTNSKVVRVRKSNQEYVKRLRRQSESLYEIAAAKQDYKDSKEADTKNTHRHSPQNTPLPCLLHPENYDGDELVCVDVLPGTTNSNNYFNQETNVDQRRYNHNPAVHHPDVIINWTKEMDKYLLMSYKQHYNVPLPNDGTALLSPDQIRYWENLRIEFEFRFQPDFSLRDPLILKERTEILLNLLLSNNNNN